MTDRSPSHLTSEQHQRAAAIAAHRRAADLMEQHPDLPAPTVHPTGELTFHASTRAEVDRVREVVGGEWRSVPYIAGYLLLVSSSGARLVVRPERTSPPSLADVAPDLVPTKGASA